MFLCKGCLENKYEGPAISWAVTSIEIGMGSLGPCESCQLVTACADIPSAASFWLKGSR